METHSDGNDIDPIDKASRVTEQFIQQQLDAHNNRAIDTPLVIKGQRCCVDCEEVVDSDRLIYVPHAVRCVVCQAAHESVNKHYGKSL